jgi:hypothetical protein
MVPGTIILECDNDKERGRKILLLSVRDFPNEMKVLA